MTKLKFEKIPFLATLVIFICSLIIIFSPLRPQITSVTPELKTDQQLLTYKNDLHGFEFQFPNTWYLFEDNNYELILSNNSFNPSVSTEVAPQEGQIFVKVYYYSSAFENGLGITESENGVVTDTKLINNDNTVGVKVEYLKSNPKILEESIAIDQITSSFKFTSDATTWKTYKNEEYGFEFKYPIYTGTGPVLRVIKTSETYKEIISQYNSSTNPRPDSCSSTLTTHSCTMYEDLLLEKSVTVQDSVLRYFVTTGGETDQSYIYLTHKNSKYLIWLGFANEGVDNQILSTFKFLPDISTWKTYKNDEYGFEFQYPSDWTAISNNISEPKGCLSLDISAKTSPTDDILSFIDKTYFSDFESFPDTDIPKILADYYVSSDDYDLINVPELDMCGSLNNFFIKSRKVVNFEIFHPCFEGSANNFCANVDSDALLTTLSSSFKFTQP